MKKLLQVPSKTVPASTSRTQKPVPKMTLSVLLIATVFLVVLPTSPTLVNGEKEAPIIYTHPSRLKINQGQLVVVQCKCAKNIPLEWFDPQGALISTNASLRLYAKVTGDLRMREPSPNDTGIYTCATVDGMYNTTTYLHVYVHHAYFFEGMIILIINAGLIIIFFACLIHSQIKSRRNKSKSLLEAEVKQVL